MSNLAITHADSGRARAALDAVLSLLLSIGGVHRGRHLRLLGAAVGLGAVVLGLAARRTGGGREATTAVILG